MYNQLQYPTYITLQVFFYSINVIKNQLHFPTYYITSLSIPYRNVSVYTFIPFNGKEF